MKFFAAVKLATFATSLLDKAGLNLETLQAAGDDTALKTLIDQAGQKPNAEAAEALADAAKENTRLNGALTEATAKADKFSALNTALADSGLKVEKPEDLKTALAAHVKKQTALALAKTGHPPVADTPDSAAAPIASTATGLNRVEASFQTKRAASSKRS